MLRTDVPITKRHLFSWLRSAGWSLQILLVILIVITVVARVVPLEMQKRLVNQAITHKNVKLLLIYSMIFLVAVLVASGVKYLITLIQTRISQKVLAQIRKDLYAHILTLPLNYFRKTPPGTLVSALVTEVAPTGELIGMALAVPLINILTFAAFIGFLLYLNWFLALISMSVYPFTMYVVAQTAAALEPGQQRAGEDHEGAVGDHYRDHYRYQRGACERLLFHREQEIRGLCR